MHKVDKMPHVDKTYSLFRNNMRQAELENERYFEFSRFCTDFVT